MDTRVHFIDLNPEPKLTEIARCITARHDSGISNHKAEHSGVFVESTNIADDENLLRGSAGNYKASQMISLTRQKRQDYPTAGNAVTVKVISEIGKIIKKVNDKN